MVVSLPKDEDRLFPPADGEQLKSIPDKVSLQGFDNLAQAVAILIFLAGVGNE